MTAELPYLIELALSEDIGRGDITTDAIYSGLERATAEFIAKDDGVIAGLELAQTIYEMVDADITFSTEIKDGDWVRRGQLIASAAGFSNKLLTSERVILNFMQRMSGIATKTRAYADAIAHTKAKVLDTRKTVPGHRYTDKWAVRIGGGQNHRMRLDDRFLIKENHIAVAGSIPKAIRAVLGFKKKHALDAEIEIEVKNLGEVNQVLSVEGVDHIMLDNMNLLNLEKAVALIAGRAKVEASGNVTLVTIADIAETGVDFISSGALTHSVKALDISLLFLE